MLYDLPLLMYQYAYWLTLGQHINEVHFYLYSPNSRASQTVQHITSILKATLQRNVLLLGLAPPVSECCNTDVNMTSHMYLS